MRSYRTLSLLMFGFAVSAAACFDDSTGDTRSAIGNGSDAGSAGGNVSGAIFTTTVDGSRVNANIYAAKTDVYLDGGPSGNAPSSSAALPEGDYFFQVTDPSGKTLLSTDHVSCRKIHINADGVIDQIYAGTNYVKNGPGNMWSAVACQHAQGVDQDHAALGAITVQLFPYLDTPNNGGEYKAWVTPIAAYTGDPAYVPHPNDDDVHDVGHQGSNAYGFVHNRTKTDNFKIKIPGTPEAPTCGDGTVQTGEDCDDGNATNDDGCSSTCTHEQEPPPHPACGDGHLDAGEQCDDGNVGSGDGCSYVCTIETPPTPCCGDGNLDAGEQCDDHNSTAGDGCSPTCTIEMPPPPPPAACCGDGHLDAGEECDDGNTIGGDGCSSTCHHEDAGGTSADGSACTTCASSMIRY